jgi:glutamyl-tRNA reductase
MGLAVIHRPRTAGAPPLGGRVWSTCLREVAFLSDTDGDSPASATVGREAYALIVEIVCGLRSPLVGETEVQAQFKAFLASLDPIADGWLLRLGQQVLGDAKDVRHRFLQGLGVGRYGALALRHATGSRIAIVGAGALAEDIVAHCEPERDVDVWSRRDSDRPHTGRPRCRRLLIADAAIVPPISEPTSLIVAAPVLEDVIGAVRARYERLADLIDLRATDEMTPVAGSVRRTTLLDILAAVDSADLAPVASARAAIHDLARNYASRGQLRPFGWDDLYA